MNKDFLTKKKKSIFQIIKIQKKHILDNKLEISDVLNENNQNNSLNESLSVFDIEKKDTTKNSLISISREVFKFIKYKKNTKGSDVTSHILDVLSKKGSNLNYKNIQRRVYDAINVMCAIGLISKEKGNIIFLGPKENEDNCLSTNNSSKVRSNDSNIPDYFEQNESDKEIKDIKNTINDQKNELIKLFIERYFIEKMVNLNQNDFKRSGCIDKLEFPFYIVTVDKKNELKIQQNDLNTKVVIYSKSDIKLYKPFDIIKILCKNDFTKENIENLKKKENSENKKLNIEIIQYIIDNKLIDNYIDNNNKINENFNNLDYNNYYIFKNNYYYLRRNNFNKFFEQSNISSESVYNNNLIENKEYRKGSDDLLNNLTFLGNSSEYIGNNDEINNFSPFFAQKH